jgi:hypothetical protein
MVAGRISNRLSVSTAFCTPRLPVTAAMRDTTEDSQAICLSAPRISKHNRRCSDHTLTMER